MLWKKLNHLRGGKERQEGEGRGAHCSIRAMREGHNEKVNI